MSKYIKYALILFLIIFVGGTMSITKFGSDDVSRLTERLNKIESELKDLKMEKKVYFSPLKYAGWLIADKTWIYKSAEDPTFTFTISGDVTTEYSPSMRIRLKQGGSYLYFIITAVSYSAPNTTITIYGGTDYDLANAAITDNYYSAAKAPHGFPFNPAKWEVLLIDYSASTKYDPAIETWYNLGNLSINIPIGLWNVSYEAALELYRTDETEISIRCTLSTANNSESDSQFTNIMHARYLYKLTVTVYMTKILNLDSKKTYYLIAKTSNSDVSSMSFRGDWHPTIIRVACAYL